MKTLSELMADVDKLNADLATANASLVTANATITTLTGERDAMKARAETAEASLTAEKAKVTDFDAQVAAEVKRLGIKPAGSTPATQATNPEQGGDLLTQYEAVKNDPKKLAAFLAENGEKLRNLV